MHVIRFIGWVVEKVKKFISDYQTEKWWSSLSDEEQRRWCLGFSDEELKERERYHQECEEAYQEYLKEQALNEAKSEEALWEERLRERRRQIEDEYGKDAYCPDCGALVIDCLCYLDDEPEKEEVFSESPADEEPEIPLWLEHAETPCSVCGLLPEFCRCQFEE